MSNNLLIDSDRTTSISSLSTRPIQKESEGLTQNELRKLIPVSAFNPPSAMNFFSSVLKISLFVGFFWLALVAQSIWLSALFTLISGIFLFSLGTVGHDCGHGAHIRPRWLNETVGQICMMLHGLPYAGWKHSHNTHHANTNKGGADPDRLWLYSDEYLAMPKVGQFFWRLFQKEFYWMSAVGHYFRSMLPWSFIIHTKTTKESEIRACRQDLILFFAGLITFHSIWFLAGFGFKSLIFHAITIIIALSCLSVYVRTEHYLLSNGEDVDVKPWLTSRTFLQGSIMDFISTNLNYHVEHHICQTVPHANLPAIRPSIKRHILESGQPYHEDTLWNFMKIAFNQEFFVLERNTFKEIPLSQLQVSK